MALLFPPNPSQVVLQLAATGGTVASATVRVSWIVAGSEVAVLTTVSLTQVGTSGVWRYVWTPGSLAAGNYVALYTTLSAAGQTVVTTEDIYVN